jgi:hypothetical protein
MGCSSSKEVACDQPSNRIHNSQIAHPPNQNTYVSNPPQGPAIGRWPKIIQGPNLPFIVHVHSHVLALSPPIGNIPCWTFISQGLSEVNELETVFTVRRRPNENEDAYPSAPIEWMRAIHGVAKAGLHIETGQMCDLVFDKGTVQLRFNTFAIRQDPRTWESFRRFGSLIHGIKQDCVFQFPDGTIPQNAHHVIALTQEETAVAKQFGPTRVIGHVGSAVRWFPHPPWVDRDRGDAVTMADQAGSIRVGLHVAQMYGLNASIIGQEILFTIPADEEKRKTFKKYVTEQALDTVLCFESFMVPEADAGMLWKSGQTRPMAYGRYSLKLVYPHLETVCQIA